RHAHWLVGWQVHGAGDLRRERLVYNPGDVPPVVWLLAGRGGAPDGGRAARMTLTVSSCPWPSTVRETVCPTSVLRASAVTRSSDPLTGCPSRATMTSPPRCTRSPSMVSWRSLP